MEKYEEGLKSERVEYFQKKKSCPLEHVYFSNTRFRENNVYFLGTAGKISENDIDTRTIKNSEIIFLEGYLWDEGDPKKAFEKAINNSKKVAMSLSDQFCVDRHKTHFLELVKHKLNITFANEQEMISLINAKSFDEVITFAKTLII